MYVCVCILKVSLHVSMQHIMETGLMGNWHFVIFLSVCL